MSNAYKVVNIEDKKVYDIGSGREVLKEILPVLADKFKKVKVCIYGDESYPWGDDEYETFYNNEYFGTPYGAKYYDAGELAFKQSEYDKHSPLSQEEADKFMDLFEGKVIDDISDKISKIKKQC